MNLYLIGYNSFACVGWAYILYLALSGLMKGFDELQIWNRIAAPLLLVQSSAVLEIVHSLFGLVRSPLSSTFIQVNSRLFVLWIYTWPVKECHEHWSLILMVLAWSFVEVPRYLFYTLNLLPQFSGKNMPYLLFALRYSLFIVLYPSGITGEILQIYTASKTYASIRPILSRIAHVHLATYIPFGPYMIFNMWYMRKRAYKKRAQEGSQKKKVNGLVWPITNRETGERSTSVTNKKIWEASVRDVDSKAADKVKRVKNWRFGYVKHVENNVRVCLKSPSNALAVAKAGLDYAKETFQFVRDGNAIPLIQALKDDASTFETGFIQGKGKKPAHGFKLGVPYKGNNLENLELLDQLDKWVENGTIEPSASDAIKLCVRHPEWMDLSDRYFVLLGATSAMGPLNVLLNLGANIIAIDLDRKNIWKRLITQARESCGTLTFPLKIPENEISNDEALFENAGANLLTMTPEIANWLCTVCPGEELTIGNYTYLDGALHVQLSLACDCIMEKVCERRKNTSIAFLCTPTDVHNIPKEAYEASKRNYTEVPTWQKSIEALDGKYNLVKNALKPVEESGLYLVDGIVGDQGPNYALAKRLQHWRAVVAHSEGHVVSSNIAPSTATKSVVSNAQFAAAYNGFHLFKSMEVMYQDTSSAVMLALLVHDLRSEKSVANPANKLDNPFQLFASGAFHGGVWRCPYKIGSIGVTSAVYYYLKTYNYLVVGAVAGLYGTIQYILKGKPF